MVSWKKAKKEKQKGDFSESRDVFMHSYEGYGERIFLKDTKRVRIERVRYKMAIASRDIDCLLFTYFNEDKSEIFKRLKSDPMDESAKCKYLPVIYDYLYDGKNTYVIEEAVNGDSLQEKLDRGELSEPQEVVKIAIHVCLALEALHKRGIIHMDVKPGNIVEKQDNTGYKLIDFNASILQENVEGCQEYPYTEGFEAPEHKRLAPACYQTDLCSLGKTMYNLLSGKIDFHAVKAHTYVKWGKGIIEVIKKSSDLHIDARYKSAAEMRHALQGKNVTNDIDTEIKQQLISAETKVKGVQDELLVAKSQQAELRTQMRVLENAKNHLQKEYDALSYQCTVLAEKGKKQATLSVVLFVLLLVSVLFHIF